MSSITADGVFSIAEKITLQKDEQRLQQDYQLLQKEYNDIKDSINSKKDQGLSNVLERYNISFNLAQSLWYNGSSNYNLNQMLQNTPQLNIYGVKNLYELLFLLLKVMIEDDKASADENNLWILLINELTLKISELKTELRSLNNKLTLIDAEDATGELVANINYQFAELYGGLQAQIDGQITNWNDKGIPLPLYDHNTNKWYNGAEWQEVADNSNGRYKTARGAAMASYYADAIE